jgi:hypothetical protein
MTRPLDRNGFGLTVADAEREVQAIEAGMIFVAGWRACLSRVAENCGAAKRLGRAGI